VDDILIIGNNVELLRSVKLYLSTRFPIKDLGEASYILGIKVIHGRSRRTTALSQSTYIGKI
jgi:hypothetical protein